MLARRGSGASRILFFCNDTATTEIYTLSLHDALPILAACTCGFARRYDLIDELRSRLARPPDRKSTRLNSSHQLISYAVFCLEHIRRGVFLGGELVQAQRKSVFALIEQQE